MVRWARLVGATVAGGLGAASLVGVAAASGPSAAQLLHEAAANLGRAPSLALNGYALQGSSRIGMLVRSTDHGREASGRLTFGPASSPASQYVSFVRLGPSIYLDANQRFWALNGGKPPLSKPVLKVLGGHWVRVPASMQGVGSSFASFTNPASMAKSLFSGLPRNVHFGPSAKVNGTAVRSIVAGSTIFDVAAKGTPLLLQAVDHSKSGGRFLISYPHTVHVTAPPGAITIAQAVQKAAKQSG